MRCMHENLFLCNSVLCIDHLSCLMTQIQAEHRGMIVEALSSSGKDTLSSTVSGFIGILSI